MKPVLLLLLLLICCASYRVDAQVVSVKKSNKKIITTIVCKEIERKDTVSKFDSTVYRRVGDTLFTNKDFKIYKGQKLLVGNGSNDNGWFKNISYNSMIDWFTIISSALGNPAETPEESQFRINNQVRDALHNEGTLYVKDIKQNGNAITGARYVVILKSRPGKANTNYRCNLQEALKSGELILPKD